MTAPTVVPPVPPIPVAAAEHVLAVGVDLVHVPSFVALLDGPGTRAAEAFTPGERLACEDRGDGPGTHLAVRWAAKEAVIKAWSSTLHGEAPPLDEAVHRHVEVVQDAWGRPRIELHGALARRATEDGLGTFHVSLSHDGDHAIAWVVLTEGAVSPSGTPRRHGGTRAASA